jgi:hypothetical protein
MYVLIDLKYSVYAYIIVVMELIKVYDNVLSPQLCADIIHKFENEANKYPGVTAGGHQPEIKNSTDFSLKLNPTTSAEWQMIDTALYTALNTTLKRYVEDILAYNEHYSWIETVSDTGFLFQKYDKGYGYYHFHDDFNTMIDLGRVHYRRLTYLFYLNDVVEGGETQIWSHYKVQPRAGRILLFPASWTYPHRGCVPLSDNKYIATGWLYAETKTR